MYAFRGVSLVGQDTNRVNSRVSKGADTSEVILRKEEGYVAGWNMPKQWLKVADREWLKGAPRMTTLKVKCTVRALTNDFEQGEFVRQNALR